MSIIDTLSSEFDIFKELSYTGDVNSLVSYFENLVIECIETHVPLKTKKKNTELPWITREILLLKRRLSRLRHASRNGNALRRAEFNTVKEKLRRKINAAKDFFFLFTLPNMVKNNPRKFWNSISPKERSTSTFVLNETPTSQPQVIANAFNEYFTSVFAQDNHEISSYTPLHASLVSIDDVSVSTEGVLNLILNVDSKKSSSPDNVNNIFLHRYSL